MYALAHNPTKIHSVNANGEEIFHFDQNSFIAECCEMVYLNANIFLKGIYKLQRINNHLDGKNKLHDEFINNIMPLLNWCNQFYCGINTVRNQLIAHYDSKNALSYNEYMQIYVIPSTNDILTFIGVAESILNYFRPIYNDKIEKINNKLIMDIQDSIVSKKPELDINDCKIKTIENLKNSNLDEDIIQYCIKKINVKFSDMGKLYRLIS